MKSLSIFCGSSSGTNGIYKNAAEQCGKLLAASGITLIYGGGSFGLMGIAANAAMQNGGKVVGIIPKLLVEKEAAKRDITELIIVDSMQERKQKLMDLSDGFLILPGGFGTMDELFEVMAFVNLGVHNKPCGILNTAGFYDHLITFIDHVTEQGFVRQRVRDFILHESEPPALLHKMKTFQA